MRTFMSPSATGLEPEGASWRELACSALLYLCLALWWLDPLVWFIDDHLTGQMDGVALVFEDLQLVVWSLAWGARALVTDPLGIFDANIFYPMPESLTFSEHFFGLLPLYAPTYWATANPILSTNITILAIFVLRGLSVQVLLRRYTGPEAAILAALFFTFSPSVDARVVKFYLLASFGLIFALFFIDRLLASARWRDMLGLGLMLGMQAATSVYLAFAAMFGVVAWTLPSLWFYRSQLDARRLLALAGAALLAVIILVPLHLPYLRLALGAELPDYIQGADLPWNMSQRRTLAAIRNFNANWVPWFVWAFAFVALIPRRRMPLAAIVGASFVGILGFVLAAGPHGRLIGVPTGWVYTLAADMIPGMSTVRSPTRFLVLVEISIALLAGLGMQAVFARLPSWPRRILAVLIGVSFIGIFAPEQHPLRKVDRGAEPGHVYRALAESGDGRAVLELPKGEWGVTAAKRMLGSTTHWQPIVDGYSGHPPDSNGLIQTLAEKLPELSALQRLVDTVDIGWIVIHRKEKGRPMRPWPQRDMPGLQYIGGYGSSDLYRVVLPMQDNRRDLFLSRARTLEGNPRADVSESCPGRIELLSIVRPPWNQNKLLIKLRFHNSGPEPWPALGAYTSKLLRLNICAAETKVCAGKGIRLEGDVPVDGHLDQKVEWVNGRRQLPRRLRLELFQQGGRNLKTCGVEPLLVAVPPRGK
ncbi:MAG TPA: hypothetical protein DCG06_03935 [Deltaproteobacteria bacterium]|nr:hypothetical protein [Deltaproteobacteria bacterium]